jgi:hemerythrin-like domain-containing protein
MRLRLVGRLAGEFENWQWSMGCHERYEEGKLYPFLQERFGADCGPLAEHHRQLHELADRCLETLRALPEDLNASTWDAAREALSGYLSALSSHLRAEEELVIPRLLDLSPAEFACYSHSETCALNLGGDKAAATV